MSPEELQALLKRVNEYLVASYRKYIEANEVLLSIKEDQNERIAIMIEIGVYRDKLQRHEKYLKE